MHNPANEPARPGNCGACGVNRDEYAALDAVVRAAKGVVKDYEESGKNVSIMEWEPVNDLAESLARLEESRR